MLDNLIESGCLGVVEVGVRGEGMSAETLKIERTEGLLKDYCCLYFWDGQQQGHTKKGESVGASGSCR